MIFVDPFHLRIFYDSMWDYGHHRRIVSSNIQLRTFLHDSWFENVNLLFMREG